MPDVPWRRGLEGPVAGPAGSTLQPAFDDSLVDVVAMERRVKARFKEDLQKFKEFPEGTLLHDDPKQHLEALYTNEFYNELRSKGADELYARHRAYGPSAPTPAQAAAQDIKEKPFLERSMLQAGTGLMENTLGTEAYLKAGRLMGLDGTDRLPTEQESLGLREMYHESVQGDMTGRIAQTAGGLTGFLAGMGPLGKIGLGAKAGGTMLGNVLRTAGGVGAYSAAQPELAATLGAPPPVEGDVGDRLAATGIRAAEGFGIGLAFPAVAGAGSKLASRFTQSPALQQIAGHGGAGLAIGSALAPEGEKLEEGLAQGLVFGTLAGFGKSPFQQPRSAGGEPQVTPRLLGLPAPGETSAPFAMRGPTPGIARDISYVKGQRPPFGGFYGRDPTPRTIELGEPQIRPPEPNLKVSKTAKGEPQFKPIEAKIPKTETQSLETIEKAYTKAATGPRRARLARILSERYNEQGDVKSATLWGERWMENTKGIPRGTKLKETVESDLPPEYSQQYKRVKRSIETSQAFPTEEMNLHSGLYPPKKVQESIKLAMNEPRVFKARANELFIKGRRMMSKTLQNIIPGAQSKAVRQVVDMDPVREDVSAALQAWRNFRQAAHAREVRAEDRLNRLTPKGERDLWLAMEKDQVPPNSYFSNIAKELKELTRETGRFKVRHLGLPKESFDRLQQDGISQYIKRIPTQQELMSKIKQLRLSRKSIQGLSQDAFGAVEGSLKAREQLDPEHVMGHRIYVKPEFESVYGSLLLAGKLEGKRGGKVHFRPIGSDKTLKIPVSHIERVGNPYVTGKKPILETYAQEGKLEVHMKFLEELQSNPRFKTLIRDWSPDLGKEWTPLRDPIWGPLRDKAMDSTLYSAIEPMYAPHQSGLMKFVNVVNGAFKEGVTIERIPGYQVKQMFMEGPMMALANGVYMTRVIPAAIKSIKEVRHYLRTGKTTEGIRELRRGVEGHDMLFHSNHLYDALEGTKTPYVADFRGVEGRGAIYLKDWFMKGLHDLQIRLERSHDRGEKGMFSVAADAFSATRDSFVGLNIAKAFGYKPGTVGGIHMSGEGLRDLSALIDGVWRLAIYNEITSKNPGMIRRMILESQGLGPEHKPMTSQEAVYQLYRTYNPRSVGSGIINTIGRYSFYRFPYMLTRAVFGEGGAIAHPINSFIVMTGLAATITAATRLYYETVYGWVLSDEDLEDQLEQVSNGDPRRVPTIALTGMHMDENNNLIPEFNDMLALQATDLLNGNFIPPNNVQPLSEPETFPGNVVRGVVATNPMLSAGYRILTGRDPLSGYKFIGDPNDANSPWMNAAKEMSVAFGISGAETVRGFQRGQAGIKSRIDQGRAPTKTTDDLWERAIFGIPASTGVDLKSPGAASNRRVIKDRAKNVERGKILERGSYWREPTHPGKDASDEEIAKYRKAMQAWLRLNEEAKFKRRFAPRRPGG